MKKLLVVSKYATIAWGEFSLEINLETTASNSHWLIKAKNQLGGSAWMLANKRQLCNPNSEVMIAMRLRTGTSAGWVMTDGKAFYTFNSMAPFILEKNTNLITDLVAIEIIRPLFEESWAAMIARP